MRNMKHEISKTMHRVIEVRENRGSTYVFTFKRPEKVYYMGETIEGNVKLTTFKNKLVKEVNIMLIGLINIEFDSVYFSGKRSQQHLVMNVPMKINSPNVLVRGEHSYDFSLKSELNAPTSLRAKFGSIKYEVRLTLFRENQHDNIFKTAITLIQPFDLNQFPIHKMPKESEKPILSNCWLAFGGRMYCTLKTQFGGYAPGQILRYTVELHNVSSEMVRSVSVQFSKIIKFVVTFPVDDDIEAETPVVIQTSLKEVMMGNIIEQYFMIPSTVPTSANENRINVRYVLKAQVKLSRCGCFKLEAHLPITIGTVPLKESLLPARNLQHKGEESSHCSDVIIPPPVFEKDFHYSSALANVRASNLNNDMDERPRYPVYRIPEPTNELTDE